MRSVNSRLFLQIKKKDSFPKRIHHNVTVEDNEAFSTLCHLYCHYEHVDLCDIRELPDVSDVNGMFWRFQPLGDPTVAIFASRDTDSYLSEREVAAVHQWLDSDKQWHIMRDLPQHGSRILGGLWGGKNHLNMTLAIHLRSLLLGKQPEPQYGFDQQTLNKVVWPVIRSDAMIHDCYHCEEIEKYGHMTPWPTRRKGFTYVGYGPTKDDVSKGLTNKKCPVNCRPTGHKDWEYC